MSDDLPPGFRILNDGPGREVLVDVRRDEADVYRSVEAARAAAWQTWREIYEG